MIPNHIQQIVETVKNVFQFAEQVYEIITDSVNKGPIAVWETCRKFPRFSDIWYTYTIQDSATCFLII